MEEKILIKSEKGESERTLKTIMISFFSACVAICLFLLVPFRKEKIHYFSSYYSSYGYEHYKTYEKTNGFEEGLVMVNAFYLVLFILMCLCFIFGVVALIIFLANRKCELTVTDKNVRGKAAFGKEVVLPLYMVSAYSTRKFLATIAVATSSGLTKFNLIDNHKEIGEVLSGLINERQTKTTTAQGATPAQSAPAPQSNSMDDLVKLKSLLDSGIITQEEFDAKKKQLLGL